MHDLKLVREQPELLRDAMRRRGALDALAPQLDRVAALEQERRTLIQQVEEQKAARNAGSAEVARRKKAGEPADELIAQGRALGEQIAAVEARADAAEQELRGLLLEIPNVTLPEVPEGGEDANVVLREWGTPREGAGLQPHWEVGARLALFELERGGKVTGSGFVVCRAEGAGLVDGLTN